MTVSDASARGAVASIRSVSGLAARLVWQWWPHVASLACACGIVAVTIAGAGLPWKGGAHAITRGTPATFAVRMVMWAEATSGYLPPGT